MTRATTKRVRWKLDCDAVGMHWRSTIDGVRCCVRLPELVNYGGQRLWSAIVWTDDLPWVAKVDTERSAKRACVILVSSLTTALIRRARAASAQKVIKR